jgi:hypothetical protein
MGNFMAGAGQVEAAGMSGVGIVVGIIFILGGLIAIIMGISGATLTSREYTGQSCFATTQCNLGEECDQARGCYKELQEGKSASKLSFIIVGLVFVVMGPLVIWYSRTVSKVIDSSRSTQQVGGALLMAQLADSALQQN